MNAAVNAAVNAADLLAGACRVEVLAAQQGRCGPRPDWLAEERPVALVANGVSQAVMLATPAQLEDFARGFAFTEGWLERPADLRSVEAVALDEGLELRIAVSSACEWRLKERRRLMAGRTGCGLCGAESLAQVRLPLPPLAAQPLSAGALERALAQLRESQPLQHLTGATHAAGWASRAGELLAVREDVGRHNALDKLLGHLLWQRDFDPRAGFVCVTSRASFELVQKTARAGIATLAAVSAPTQLAVQTADAAGLLLIGFARGADWVAYTHTDRMLA